MAEYGKSESGNAFNNTLGQELSALEGIHGQHPETGSLVSSGSGGGSASYLSEYTNRLFGAPFQFLPSVDARFDSINSFLGTEYLRNFILNSPIIYIKPGLPKYTGSIKGEGIVDLLFKSSGTDKEGMSAVNALMMSMAKKTVFGSGSKLQRRMFGFRERYYQYMGYVNYMCRSLASFLSLTEGGKFPNGTIVSEGKFEQFKQMDWQNYRMLSGSKCMKPSEYLSKIAGSTNIGAIAFSVADITNLLLSSSVDVSVAGAKTIFETAKTGAEIVSQMLSGDEITLMDGLKSIAGPAVTAASNIANNASETMDSIKENFDDASGHVNDVIADKISCVQFMVEPTSFDETLTNRTKESLISSAVNAVGESIGSEIAFITGSNRSPDLIMTMVNLLGGISEATLSGIANVVEPLTGGFANNLFQGALRSIKGQKMLYPKIYQSSESETNYSFTIDLFSPYGDIYNYYMNILVPLMHLIALAAPRMVSANSNTSPFLVQAFIPGMVTCNLGIVKLLKINKNPDNEVSVNGFPLHVKVTLEIEELYNSLSISPANDPSSFLFNETLNDYMANLAGLMPSSSTYTKQRKVMFENLEEYISSGEYVEDIIDSRAVPFVEDLSNQYIRKGS